MRHAHMVQLADEDQGRTSFCADTCAQITLQDHSSLAMPAAAAMSMLPIPWPLCLLDTTTLSTYVESCTMERPPCDSFGMC